MTRIAFLAASLSFALIGCRGGDDTTGDDQPGMDGSGSNAGDVTIQEVQNDAMATGTAVELRGVVVTAIDIYGARTGDLWVGEPEGGAFSGVKVYGASLTDIAMLQVGDLVDITGAQKHEACTQAAPCGTVVFDNGASITEVEGVTQGSLVITKRSQGTLPPASMVDAKAISEIADPIARAAEWEKWEGVLINVQNARQLSAVVPFSDGNEDQKQFNATGGLKVQSSLTDLGTNAVAGTCFSGMTGIGDFFFDALLLPRESSALVTGGTGCTALTTASIADVQAGTATGSVQINDVYVSAVAFNKKNFWIQTAPTASSNNGLYVFRCSGMGCNTTAELPATVVVGAKVSILGSVVEFANGAGGTLTQLTAPTITVSADAPVAITPVSGQTVTALLADITGEPFESVLISLTNVKVVTAGTNGGTPVFGVSDLAQFPGNLAFKSDDDLYRFVVADMSACYASITGIWTYTVYDDRFQFLQTGPGTLGGTCN